LVAETTRNCRRIKRGNGEQSRIERRTREETTKKSFEETIDIPNEQRDRQSLLRGMRIFALNYFVLIPAGSV
jgi:hypothetical protein